jgi:ubiquitin-protein ligase
MTTKLLANQLRSLLNDPVEGFTVEADEANFFDWKVWIEGPPDTCYAGGVFQLTLKFPKDYPMSPPELKFVSDFWHPNGMCFILYRLYTCLRSYL